MPFEAGQLVYNRRPVVDQRQVRSELSRGVPVPVDPNLQKTALVLELE
jgi:hypothetical protein